MEIPFWRSVRIHWASADAEISTRTQEKVCDLKEMVANQRRRTLESEQNGLATLVRKAIPRAVMKAAWCDTHVLLWAIDQIAFKTTTQLLTLLNDRNGSIDRRNPSAGRIDDLLNQWGNSP